MASKEERVHNVFEKIYDNYDKMNSVISFQQHLKWRKDTMKKNGCGKRKNCSRCLLWNRVIGR